MAEDAAGRASDLRERGRRLGAERRWRDAARATRAATDLYRELARVDPGHAPALAAAQVELGSWLAGLGWLDEAAYAVHRGEQEWRRAIPSDPRYAVDLAHALIIRSAYDAAAGDRVRARDAAVTAAALPLGADLDPASLDPERRRFVERLPAAAQDLIDRSEQAPEQAARPVAWILAVLGLGCAALAVSFALGLGRPASTLGLVLGGALAAAGALVPLGLVSGKVHLGPYGRVRARGYAGLAGLACGTFALYRDPGLPAVVVGGSLIVVCIAVMTSRYVRAWASTRSITSR